MSSRLSQNIMLGVVAAIFIGGVLWGVISGGRAGKSAVILSNTEAVTKGLQFFYDDQNRYPTTVEFLDKDLMLEYFDVFPFATIAGGSCSKTYSYTNPTQKSYKLGFCLPKARSGFNAGINQVAKP